jgi:ADP-ribosyl-[dinitrogen reductase] hydrolase
VDAIRPWYGFDAMCQGTVPEAVIAYLEAADYEDDPQRDLDGR